MKNSSTNTKVVFSSAVVRKDEKHVLKKFAESCWNYFYQKTLILLTIETLLKIGSEIVIIIGDFKTEVTQTCIRVFGDSYKLKSRLEDETCYKTPKKTACKNPILTKTIENVLIINFFF